MGSFDFVLRVHTVTDVVLRIVISGCVFVCVCIYTRIHIAKDHTLFF